MVIAAVLFMKRAGDLVERQYEGGVLNEGFDHNTPWEDETGVKADRNVLCGAMLNKLEHYLGMVESREFLNEYRRRELLTGNTITANVGGNTLTGMAMGIDDNANLIIKLPDGKLKKLSSGEASLCRVKQ